MGITRLFIAKMHGQEEPFSPVDFALETFGNIANQRDSAEIKQAYAALKQAMQVPSPIARHIRDILDKNQENRGLFKEEFALFLNALPGAVSFATRRISLAVYLLNHYGFYAAANLVTDNLAEEAGVSFPDSHLKLLFDSTNIIGQNIGCSYLGPSSNFVAENLWNLRQIPGYENLCKDKTQNSLEKIKAYKEACAEHLPLHQQTNFILQEPSPSGAIGTVPENSITHAIKILDTLPESVGRLAYRYSPLYPQNVSNDILVMQSVFELLTLEADADRESHIRAYHHMLHHYAGIVVPQRRADLFRWSKIHISDDAGVEADHVKAAGKICEQITKNAPDHYIIAGFQHATEMMNLRNAHWEDVVTSMETIREEKLALDLSPIKINPASEPSTLHQAWMRTDEAIRMLPVHAVSCCIVPIDWVLRKTIFRDDAPKPTQS